MGKRETALALLAAALLVWLLEPRELAALLGAVLAHEAGHLLVLRLLGWRFRAPRPAAAGLRIDYAGDGGIKGEILSAAAGPAAGLVYAWAAVRFGARCGWETLRLSGELSLLLSAFNLLPAPPLDGGRIAAALLSLWPGGARGERAAKALGLVTALLLCAAGIWSLVCRRGAALLIAGGTLLSQQLRELAAACGCAGCRPRETPRRPASSRAFHTASGRRPATPRR